MPVVVVVVVVVVVLHQPVCPPSQKPMTTTCPIPGEPPTHLTRLSIGSEDDPVGTYRVAFGKLLAWKGR